MKQTPLSVLFATIACAMLPGFSAHAASGAKSGEQVVKEVCAACHASGVANAPKIADKAAWAPLIAEGQVILTAHAWVGVRAMPAQGGAPQLQLAEFASAVAWMAREAGGDWADPDAAQLKNIRKEAVKRLDKTIQDARAMQRKLRQ